MSFATSWDDWTSDSGSRPLPLAARGGDVYVIAHHAVNRVVQDTIALSKPGGRQVSMSFAIGPTVAGVEAPVYCVGVVPEDRRPYTTASSLDGAALTAEVSNLNLSADYPVAASAKEWLAQIAAYAHTDYGMPLDRVHVLDHQEVYARGYGSYPTACPGPDLHESMDFIVERAKDIVTPTLMRRSAMTTRFAMIGSGDGKGGAGTLVALAGDVGYPCPGNWDEYRRDPADGSDRDRAAVEFQIHGPVVWLTQQQWPEAKARYTTPPVVGTVESKPDPQTLTLLRELVAGQKEVAEAVAAPRTTTVG